MLKTRIFFFLVVHQLFLSIKSYSIKSSNDRNNDNNKNKQDTYFSERISYMLYALCMFNIVFYHKIPEADVTITAIIDDNDL